MLYKVTDSRGCTRGGTQWGPGITHTAKGDPSQDLNSDGWIHAYEHPVLALIFKSLHTDPGQAVKRLWEADGIVERRCGHIKCACRTLTTVREIAFPDLSLMELADIAEQASRTAGRTTVFASAWAERSVWAARQARLHSKQGDREHVLLHTARALETATFSVPNQQLDLIGLIESITCLAPSK